MNYKKNSKNKSLLLFGRWTSYIGNIIFDYANNNVIANTLGLKPIFLAFYQSSEMIIALIFNLIGGAFADRYNKKKILIITDIISSILCFILSFVTKTKVFVVAIILINCLLAIVTAFNKPSYKSIVRIAMNKEEIVKYNSISDIGSQIIEIIGPTVGMLMVLVFDTRGAMLANAITFFLSAIAESKLVITETRKSSHDKKIIEDIWAGLKYIKSNKCILIVIIVASAANFFFAGYNLYIPYTSTMFKEQLPNAYAVILTVESIGGIIGSFIISKMDSFHSISDKKLIIILGMSGLCIFFIPIISMLGIRYIVIIPFFVFSALLSIFNIGVMTYIQLYVIDEYMGRVFSIISTFSVLFMPLGSFFFSYVNNDVNCFFIISIGIVILSITGVFLLSFNSITGKNKS